MRLLIYLVIVNRKKKFANLVNFGVLNRKNLFRKCSSRKVHEALKLVRTQVFWNTKEEQFRTVFENIMKKSQRKKNHTPKKSKIL